MWVFDEGWEEACFPVHSKPLLQIFSIKIIASDAPQPICGVKDTAEDQLKVCGKFSVVDDANSHYYVYDREDSDRECVSLGGFLTLTSPDRPIPATRGMNIHAQLSVKASRYTLGADYVLPLEVDIEDDHVRLLSLKLNYGAYDFVVEYCVLQCGVTGMVDVTLKNKGLSTEVLDLKMFAYYSTLEYQKRYPQMALQNSVKQYLGPNSKSSVELNCKHLAVPSHESFMIKVQLNGHEEFQPCVPNHRYSRRRYKFGDIILKVNVTWIGITDYVVSSRQQPPCYLYYRHSDDEEEEEDDDYEEEESYADRCPDLMTEVFSIYIGCLCNHDMELYGTIKVRTDTDEWCLFHKDESTPEVLLAPEKKLRIEGPPRPFLRVPFYLTVDLEDKRSGLPIKGHNLWDELPNSYSRLLFDRRLLACIQGNIGYVAIHYMMISKAISARIKVEAVGEDTTEVTRHVRGTIYAQYGIQKYDTRYDRDFYRSVLFKDDCAGELTVKEGKCEIPLTKNLVCVDYRSSLFLDIDVGIEIVNEKKEINEVFFKQIVEFKTPGTSLKISCQGESFEISVSWNNISKT